uniref:Helitron helicase-like domain-containing protein n=1 Tax=Lactuca sativa TaxID=4236 RepID=A0A9R1WCH3_LACSA|nr:hypothetical protein LSAT_V11C200065880 [Lactuca sativa]
MVVVHVPVLLVYYDCGNCSCICEFCGVIFWYNERVLYLSRADNQRYTKCCKSDTIVLPPPLSPPVVLSQLFEDGHFLHNIRAYNSMFSMTSFGAKVDDEINNGRGPYVFKISGQIFHRIGSFCSDDSSQPRFYSLFSVDVINSLSHMLDTHNEYVRTFKTTRDMAESMCLDSYGVCLFNNVPDRRYGTPAPGTLGCIVCGDNVIGVVYDIAIYSKSGLPQRVSKLHPSYMPLQYPLLFPYGEDGWSPKMCIRGCNDQNFKTIKTFQKPSILITLLQKGFQYII